MPIEESEEKPEGLPERVWGRLALAEKPDSRLISEEDIIEFYRIGIVDYKKFSANQWNQVFKTLPQNEGLHLVNPESWKKITPFFFKGTIRKPFDPAKIKPGLKPLTWLQDFYQKVARFETKLTPEAWKKLIESEIKPQFIKDQKLVVDSKFKDFLRKVLQEQPSKLRELELWYHQDAATTLEPAPEKTAAPVVIQDSFEARPEAVQKKAAIDKLYFQHEQKPDVDDQESLEFLEELAQEDEEDDLII